MYEDTYKVTNGSPLVYAPSPTTNHSPPIAPGHHYQTVQEEHHRILGHEPKSNLSNIKTDDPKPSELHLRRDAPVHEVRPMKSAIRAGETGSGGAGRNFTRGTPPRCCWWRSFRSMGRSRWAAEMEIVDKGTVIKIVVDKGSAYKGRWVLENWGGINKLDLFFLLLWFVGATSRRLFSCSF